MFTTFHGNLFSYLKIGQVLVIAGKTVDGASELDILLKSGKTPEANIPLAIFIRFDDKSIIRNSKIDSEWGDEEINTWNDYSDSLLDAGNNFKIYIFIGDDQFHLSLNGKKFSSYTYRLPVDSIQAIEMGKDLQAVTQIDHRRAYPSPWPCIQYDTSYTDFSNDIPDKFKPGHAIYITGIPYGNPNGWFQVNFTEGATQKIALHFNARFEPHNVVVRNSMNDDLSWNYSREERSGTFPFEYNVQFKLGIAFTDNQFIFAINGIRFGNFTYRSYKQLDILNGFKIVGSYGLHVEVSAVDHMDTGRIDCNGFEMYSHPDIMIL